MFKFQKIELKLDGKERGLGKNVTPKTNGQYSCCHLRMLQIFSHLDHRHFSKEAVAYPISPQGPFKYYVTLFAPLPPPPL